jgi:hypothetical protein
MQDTILVPGEGEGAGKLPLKEGPYMPTGQSTAFLECPVEPPMERKGDTKTAGLVSCFSSDCYVSTGQSPA